MGGKLAFIATVSNRGPSTATGVVVKGTVPARVRSGLTDPNLKDNKARRGVKIRD